MTTREFVLTLILAFFASGGLAVAIVGIVRDALAHKRAQKDKKSDRDDAIAAGVRYLLYDRIKINGQCYIFNGTVDFDDRRILKDMHRVYHDGLGGNGDLDVLMKQVDELPLKLRK